MYLSLSSSLSISNYLSREFTPSEKEQRAYSFCGTIEYMAPEVVVGGNHGHNVVSS